MSKSGNSVTGNYTLSQNGTDTDNFVDAGSDTLGSFSVSETSTESFNDTTVGNAASGAYTLSGGSTTTYTMREVESGGLYTLTETGVDGATQAESGNVVTAAYLRVVTGTDSFTLAESATTMTAIESYTDTVSGNTAQDTSTTTTTGSGTYTYAGSGSSWWTYGYTLEEAGNARAGSFSQSMTGTDRYSLMTSFDNVANTLAGQDPGNVTFHSHGLPFRDPSPGASGNPFGAMAWVSDVTHQGGNHAAALIGGPPVGLGLGVNPANGGLAQWTGWTTGVGVNTQGLTPRYVPPPPPPSQGSGEAAWFASYIPEAPYFAKFDENHIMSPGDIEALNATKPGGSVHEQAPAVAAAVHVVGTIVMTVPLMVVGMGGPMAGALGFESVAAAMAPASSALMPVFFAQSALGFANAVAHKDALGATHSALGLAGFFFPPAMVASSIWDVVEGVHTLSKGDDPNKNEYENYENKMNAVFGIAGGVAMLSHSASEMTFGGGEKSGSERSGGEKSGGEKSGGEKGPGIVGEVNNESGKPVEVRNNGDFVASKSEGVPAELGGGTKGPAIVGEVKGEWGAGSESPSSGRKDMAIFEDQASQRKAALENVRSMAKNNSSSMQENMVATEGGAPEVGGGASAERGANEQKRIAENTEKTSTEEARKADETRTEAECNDPNSCFAAGTPLLTPTGSKPIESLVRGDLILSRDQNDVEGVVEPKIVEEVFVGLAPVIQVHVGGQAIITTLAHPFWVQGKGWLPARELMTGDRLLGRRREGGRRRGVCHRLQPPCRRLPHLFRRLRRVGLLRLGA